MKTPREKFILRIIHSSLVVLMIACSLYALSAGNIVALSIGTFLTGWLLRNMIASGQIEELEDKIVKLEEHSLKQDIIMMEAETVLNDFLSVFEVSPKNGVHTKKDTQ